MENNIKWNWIIEKYEAEMIQFRRELHQIPETSGQEYKTQDLICSYLEKHGIEYKKVADTGVYAILRFVQPGKTAAFRADMDALAVTEETELPFASAKKGMMHACGHDAHMAMVLGTILVLSERKDSLRGNAVFLFQPAEERFGGAKRMIAEGVLENPHVDAVFGMHVWPQLPAGKIGLLGGPVMACPDIFKITFKGKGGHGANPHLSVNPIVPLAKMVSAVNDIVALYRNPQQTAVVSVCSICAGDSYNVIPDIGEMEGTIRTYHKESREQIIANMEEAAKGLACMYGTNYEFWLNPDAYPVTANDSALTKWTIEKLKDELGEEQIDTELEPAMTGEDFGYYGECRPSVFMWIGNRDSQNQYELHHPKFTVKEEILSIGVRSMCCLAETFVTETL